MKSKLAKFLHSDERNKNKSLHNCMVITSYSIHHKGYTRYAFFRTVYTTTAIHSITRVIANVKSVLNNGLKP